MKTINAIRAARQHVVDNVENEPSARFCLAESIRAFDEGLGDVSLAWARRSLAYSVGIGHADFRKFL